MIQVALTGNVASGKSRVAGVWSAQGVPVVSADDLAREVVAPGTSGLAAVVDAFGPEVLAADGTLDRAALRRRVFAEPALRSRLEEILHPRIWEARALWVEARRAEGPAVVVAEIPLLFETGRQADFDVTVLVDAPEEERLRRLVEDRGLPEAEARGMMAAQMDATAKRELADHVLDNSGSLADLEERARALMATILRGAPGGLLRMDLHLHTAGSWDCLSDPRRVLERALELGMGRIAITDHDRLSVARRMAEEYPDRVIPGEEVKTAEGVDVIGLYLREEIPRGTPAREVVELIRAQGGVPYLPHPYARGKGGGGRLAEELAALVEVVEVFNARLHPGRLNAPARELALRHGRLQAAGSDAHTIGEIGGAWVEVPAHANTPEGLMAALASSRVQGSTAPHWVHLASTWAKVRKKLPGSPAALG